MNQMIVARIREEITGAKRRPEKVKKLSPSPPYRESTRRLISSMSGALGDRTR